jgi:hypothetical protein
MSPLFAQIKGKLVRDRNAIVQWLALSYVDRRTKLEHSATPRVGSRNRNSRTSIVGATSVALDRRLRARVNMIVHKNLYFTLIMISQYNVLTTYEPHHLTTHLVGAQRWDDLVYLLTDLPFLEAKTEFGLVRELAMDFTRAVHNLPETSLNRRNLELLGEAVGRESHFICRRTGGQRCERWVDSSLGDEQAGESPAVARASLLDRDDLPVADRPVAFQWRSGWCALLLGFALRTRAMVRKTWRRCDFTRYIKR